MTAWSRDMSLEAVRKRRKEYQRIRRSMLRDNGRCNCGRKLRPGYKCCGVCQEKALNCKNNKKGK